uniref:Protein kinase domain-containing protein n=1 Tax=Cynoglossus semilaevis TaxID=244447 RepID=A0A3P8UZ34_CYNSE
MDTGRRPVLDEIKLLTMDAPLDNYLIPLMESCGYSVKSLLGHGGFGSVYLCRRSDTDESVAVKAIKIKDAKNGQEEVEVLRQLKKLDADKHNLVRFIRHLEHGIIMNKGLIKFMAEQQNKDFLF